MGSSPGLSQGSTVSSGLGYLLGWEQLPLWPGSYLSSTSLSCSKPPGVFTWVLNHSWLRTVLLRLSPSICCPGCGPHPGMAPPSPLPPPTTGSRKKPAQATHSCYRVGTTPRTDATEKVSAPSLVPGPTWQAEDRCVGCEELHPALQLGWGQGQGWSRFKRVSSKWVLSSPSPQPT